MKQDEIIEMAEQAGFTHPNPHDGYMGLAYDRRTGTDTGASLEAFAKLVAAKKQEDIIQIIKETPFSNWFQADVIEAIRARGEQA